ncbi:MAG: tRNA (guanosine(46)-N7)-methyltransferase TrmB [Lachnospiraceae bacterium]|jgi:tRNA (guanine-N7-)-methyltransferase|nr:tRNA (guanosine(46)-N7)-methyltransferase TrmB [Lachnospiraceae bacterium]
MRLKNVPGSKEYIAASKFVIHDETERKGKVREYFSNDKPIRIEIGMGKGQFIYELARLNPDINYVGIEKYSSVLLRAIQKMEEEPLDNLIFIRMDAEEITDVFDKDEVDRIYLNFSDPWPKDRHAKRRLESRQFLARYKEILKSKGLIEFKTDNNDLFEFALEEINEEDWILVASTRDLHADAKLNEGNIMTEYEAKFSAAGNPINKYILQRKS